VFVFWGIGIVAFCFGGKMQQDDDSLFTIIPPNYKASIVVGLLVAYAPIGSHNMHS